jgi:hypothetical protein
VPRRHAKNALHSATPAASAPPAPPFAPGDRVYFQPSPDGVESVRRCEFIERGWHAWWVTTERGRDLAPAQRFVRADDLALIASQGDFAQLHPAARRLRSLRVYRWRRHRTQLALVSAVGLAGGLWALIWLGVGAVFGASL